MRRPSLKAQRAFSTVAWAGMGPMSEVPALGSVLGGRLASSGGRFSCEVTMRISLPEMRAVTCLSKRMAGMRRRGQLAESHRPLRPDPSIPRRHHRRAFRPLGLDFPHAALQLDRRWHGPGRLGDAGDPRRAPPRFRGIRRQWFIAVGNGGGDSVSRIGHTMRVLPPDEHLGWTPLVRLIWLGFFFVQPGFDAAFFPTSTTSTGPRGCTISPTPRTRAITQRIRVTL